tara:strand:- start:435 stop:1001 length:567 start_codon:yes stop_codon:yes gene_type:complete
MKMLYKLNYTGLLLLFIAFFNVGKLKAAENLMIYKGTLSRTISIESLEILVETNKATGTLKNIINLTNQNKEELAKILNQQFDLPVVITSNLLNSKIGKVIISRVTKVIYPNKNPDPKISIPAIRSGVINGIVSGNGKLSLIGFLRAYPNKNIAINYGALSKIINKAESMADLVEFFTGSPLATLKSN